MWVLRKPIKNLITSEASKGKFLCNFYGGTPNILLEKLKLEGFKVEWVEESRDAYLRIEW